MKVGITATRDGATEAQLAALKTLLLELGATRFHHGDCIGGDAQGHDVAKSIGLYVVVHPPLKEKLRAWCVGNESRIPKDYLVRNRDIVNETDVLIGMPKGPEEQRSGTWSTVRYARKTAGKTVVVIKPDGTVE